MSESADDPRTRMPAGTPESRGEGAAAPRPRAQAPDHARLENAEPPESLEQRLSTHREGPRREQSTPTLQAPRHDSPLPVDPVVQRVARRNGEADVGGEAFDRPRATESSAPSAARAGRRSSALQQPTRVPELTDRSERASTPGPTERLPSIAVESTELADAPRRPQPPEPSPRAKTKHPPTEPRSRWVSVPDVSATVPTSRASEPTTTAPRPRAVEERTSAVSPSQPTLAAVRTQTRRERSNPSKPKDAPVQVHIGVIEVVTMDGAATPGLRAPSRQAPVSLADYLARRRGRG
ncbi:MAG: hypothetical protein AAF799_20665 [Myxococcota bacterium]